MKISVDVKIGPQQDALLRALEPARLMTFMQAQAKDMVAQVRKNILSAGALAGKKWPPLSRDYAKRKRLGKTPGKGKFKYAMLRDTGQMYDSLGSQVMHVGDGIRVDLTATGSRGGGVTNAELLSFHVTGTKRMPARDPTFDMKLFEKRFADALARHLASK